jgi:2-polyprenyl-6-methoxyphenol hydroxylase-like FAD-dependent oxidoreductase
MARGVPAVPRVSASGPREFDVIIVGAGIIGAVMACLLMRQGSAHRCAWRCIADRFKPEPPADADWDLRVFALSRASERLLKLCGIWDSCAGRAREAVTNACASGMPRRSARDRAP